LTLQQIGIKFVGALLSSYALFSVIERFSESIAQNTSTLISTNLGTGGTYITYQTGSLSIEIILFAIGLTLLLANFDFLFKK